MKKKKQQIFAAITAVLTAIGITMTACQEPKLELPVLTGTVSITGTAEVGQTLTANTDSLDGEETISYQWKRGTTNIGTNSNTYIVQSADVGSTITVTVTRAGYSGSVTSEPVGPVTDQSLPALTGTVSITGIAEIGQTLTANIGSLGGAGTIYYQWNRSGTAISGANANNYTVQSADVGSTITVTITRSGNSGSIISEPIVITIGEVIQPTLGLAFTLINNGTAYSVSKGTATANEVVISAFYNELPVTEIPSQGFSGYTNLTSVKIPSSVTSIGYEAFYGCTGLTSITIPFVGATLNGSSNTNFGYIFGASNVYDQNPYIPASLKTVVITGGTSIGNNAFDGCTGLTSITIPSSVTSIGKEAFYDCSGLTSIIIPSSVTSIGYEAFYDCSGLTSITIPSSVTNIDVYALFYGCTSLTSITIPFVGATLNGSSNTYFGYIFGASNYSNQNSFIPSSLKTVVITGGTSIGSSAFYGCTSLSRVTIPDCVTSIGYEAFRDCTSLSSVNIPDGVISIGSNAFPGTALLTWFNNQPDGLVYAGKVAYQYKGNMPANTSITLLDGTTQIYDYAFQNRANLASVTIPDSVTSIGNSAFSGCTSLTGIIIPNSVTSIGNSAFSGCTSLTGITIPNSVTSIGNSAFSGCTSLSITWYYNPALTATNFSSFLRTVIIPNSVTSIGNYAFENCTSLTSVTFERAGIDISNTYFTGNLQTAYTSGGVGTYTRPNTSSTTWTKQE